MGLTKPETSGTDPALSETFQKLGELEKDFAAVELDACKFSFCDPSYRWLL